MDARYRLSADPADIDRARVHRWLSDDSYWAAGRSRGGQGAAVDGPRWSVALEAATGGQVAFARVPADGATFARLCDVYVDREHRGARVGTALMECVVRELEALDLRRWVLRTGDAHSL